MTSAVPYASPVWHPFWQHGLRQPIETIVEAKGAWLTGAGGRKILDAISSWWVITHGHGHPRLAQAIARQAATLDQIIFSGFTHKPAEDLAAELIELAPKGLAHVFFSDSGSTSVEVALKMALGAMRNLGEPRTRIAAFEHAYHGDTVGTMSVGARGVFNAAYEPLLYDVIRLPFPCAGEEERTIEAFEAAAREEPLAALIVEPLVLGAGGMLMYKPAVLQELARLCRAHGAYLIFDEVMTGWGRTGTLFAAEQVGVTPDILCLAKGLTGGAIPLAATLCRHEIFAAHYCEDRARMFFHSSSYTANPIACAAGLANVRIWREEPVLDRVRALSEAQARALAPFRDDRRFQNVRRLGTITAMDVAVEAQGYLSALAPRLYEHFMSRGVLLRPLGQTIYVMPPYCTTEDDLALIYAAVQEAPDAI